MTNTERNNNLNVPIYLNQKMVFDLVATANNGLVQMEKVATAEESKNTLNSEVNAGLGNKNVFSLFGISFSGNRTSGEQTQKEAEKIHTPSSLFNTFHDQLAKEGIVRKVESSADLNELKPGSFVEFEGSIHANPMIEMLENMAQLMGLANLFQDEPNKKGAKAERESNKRTVAQIKGLLSGLQTNDMQDLICNCESENPYKAVMPVYKNYFFNNNMNEIVDGTFHVLGKVTKICLQEGSVDLFRNTSFKMFRQQILGELMNAFKDLDTTIHTGDLSTEIEAPAMIVIPIAIYI